MNVNRQIAIAARAAWKHAEALLFDARLVGALRGDLDALADYADEQRDRWTRADYQARRSDDRQAQHYTADGYDPFAEPGEPQ